MPMNSVASTSRASSGMAKPMVRPPSVWVLDADQVLKMMPVSGSV